MGKRAKGKRKRGARRHWTPAVIAAMPFQERVKLALEHPEAFGDLPDCSTPEAQAQFLADLREEVEAAEAPSRQARERAYAAALAHAPSVTIPG